MSNRDAYESIYLLQQAVSRLRAGEHTARVRSLLAEQLVDAELRDRALEILALSLRTGAAPAAALNHLAQERAERLELERKLEHEFAAPKATARLVMALPIVVLIFGQLLGLPVLTVIATNRVAQLAAIAGAALLFVGHRWSLKILRTAAPTPESSSHRLDLLATSLRCGLGFSLAIKQVALPAELEAQLVTERRLARERGSPIAELVALKAQSIRKRHTHEALLRVREAGVRLMVPLGATVLPALLLLLVVPIGLGLTQQAIT